MLMLLLMSMMIIASTGCKHTKSRRFYTLNKELESGFSRKVRSMLFLNFVRQK
jgi:hypothetical protein